MSLGCLWLEDQLHGVAVQHMMVDLSTSEAVWDHPEEPGEAFLKIVTELLHTDSQLLSETLGFHVCSSSPAQFCCFRHPCSVRGYAVT